MKNLSICKHGYKIIAALVRINLLCFSVAESYRPSSNGQDGSNSSRQGSSRTSDTVLGLNFDDGDSGSRATTARSSADEDEDIGSLFHKFCCSSTIHGTYYWMESKTASGKSFWVAMVVMGVLMSVFIIRSSFAGWKDNPVITSVMQKSIEEIPFPSITICPTDETRRVKNAFSLIYEQHIFGREKSCASQQLFAKT